MKIVREIELSSGSSNGNLSLIPVAFEQQYPSAGKRFKPSKDSLREAVIDRYCFSLIPPPFPLNRFTFITHFSWCVNFLFFNFEESALEICIYNTIADLKLNYEQLRFLILLLIQHPSMRFGINHNRWLQLRESNPEKPYSTNVFTRKYLAETDSRQRALLLTYLLDQLLTSYTFKPFSKDQLPNTANDSAIAGLPRSRRYYEACSFNFLKLNDELSENHQRDLITFLYDFLQPAFKKFYSFTDFEKMFSSEASKVLELQKLTNVDFQTIMLLFRELKKRKLLVVSWIVIERRIKIYKNEVEIFKNLSSLSSGKIDARKRNRVRKGLEPFTALRD